MKKLPLLAFIVLAPYSLFAQEPVFDWAGSIGGGSYDLGADITTDAAGNVYSIGAIQGVAIDMDPGPAGSFVNANGGYDTYIHKVDAYGYLDWYITFGGSQNDVGLSIALDGDGNIFATGHFFGTTDFDPGVGVTELTSNGDRDVYILKLDANGDFLWARSFGASDDDYGYAVATDATGNVYTTGKFEGTVDFDPGPGTAIHTASANDDFFVQKLDANGNFLWANTMGGAGNDRGLAITTDLNGNVYTTGTFFGTIDFDPGVGVLELSTTGSIFDIFIQKLDTDGNLVWAKVMGGSNWDFGHAIAVDAIQNVYTTGYFHFTVDFDPGVGVANLTSNGEADIFVQKLDANGDFVWAKSMGSSSGDSYGHAIDIDAAGNVYTTGEFSGIADFDPGAGTYFLSSSGFSDIYYQKLDPDGNFLWATKFGASSPDIGQGITVDASGNICGTGYFGSTVDFDPGPGITNLTAVGGDSEVFIQKFQAPSTVGVYDNLSESAFQVFPNPTTGEVRISIDNTQGQTLLRVFNMSGKLVREEQLGTQTAFNLQLPEEAGIYLVQLTDSVGRSSSVRLVKN
ncbi:MAG: T9SS type A sorting domain-containing protein [Flavobacteriales bacterium]|nr:T9SS type A sorting domain-containing protein [Flavobacteriales bacterium]